MPGLTDSAEPLHDAVIGPQGHLRRRTRVAGQRAPLQARRVVVVHPQDLAGRRPTKTQIRNEMTSQLTKDKRSPNSERKNVRKANDGAKVSVLQGGRWPTVFIGRPIRGVHRRPSSGTPIFSRTTRCFRWYRRKVGKGKRTWMPRRMQVTCNRLETRRWPTRSSAVSVWRTRPSTRASRKASLYCGRPMSSNQRTTHWWSSRPAFSSSSATDKASVYMSLGLDIDESKIALSALGLKRSNLVKKLK